VKRNRLYGSSKKYARRKKEVVSCQLSQGMLI
jgi:hypothetical protein